MVRRALYPLNDFSLGVIDNVDPVLIPDNALADANNFFIFRGKLECRYGYAKYTPVALANPIKRLYTFYKSDYTNEFLAVSNATLYKDNAGTLNSIPFNTITALTSSDTQMLTYKDRSLTDVVLIADGGKLKVYDGTDVAEATPHTPSTDEQTDPGLNDLANLTNFRAIAIKKDRIFALAHGTVKNRLSFCHHDPTLGYAVFDYWPATFFFDLVSEQNDESITLRTFRDAIVVFNRRTVWSLTGDGRTITDYDMHRVNVPSGLVAPDSVAFVGNNIFYLSDDHVYALFSTDQNYISAQIVSQNLENTLKSISLADKQKAVGVFFDNKYWLSFPSGLTLVYDTILNAWTKFTNINANCFLERDGVLYFSSDAGLIYQFDETVFNDDGAAILPTMKTRKIDMGLPVQDKKFYKTWTVAKQYDSESSSFNLTAIIDDISISIGDISTDLSGEWDESNWDEALWDFKDVVQMKTTLNKRGKTIQYVISNDQLDEPLTIYQLVTQYKPKRPR